MRSIGHAPAAGKLPGDAHDTASAGRSVRSSGCAWRGVLRILARTMPCASCSCHLRERGPMTVHTVQALGDGAQQIGPLAVVGNGERLMREGPSTGEAAKTEDAPSLRGREEAVPAKAVSGLTSEVLGTGLPGAEGWLKAGQVLYWNRWPMHRLRNYKQHASRCIAGTAVPRAISGKLRIGRRSCCPHPEGGVCTRIPHSRGHVVQSPDR